jgi:hypothetical protein
MNFREWIINEELWGTRDGKRWHGLKQTFVKIRYPIYRNPTPQEFQNVLDFPADRQYAGGFLMSNGDLIIWPRGVAEHLDVEEHVRDKSKNYDYAVALYAYDDGQVDSSHYNTWNYEAIEDYVSHHQELHELDDALRITRNIWRHDPRIQQMYGKAAPVGKTA